MTTATTATTTLPTPQVALLSVADDARFCALYTRYQTDVLAHARRVLGSSASGSVAGVSADDLAQEAWLRVWRAWPTLGAQPDAAIGSYLYRATRSVVIDFLRYRQMRRRHGQDEMTDAVWEVALVTLPSSAPQDALEAVALAREAQREVWALARQRIEASSKRPERDLALLAALVEEIPSAESAARWGMTCSAVTSSQTHLRRRLRPVFARRRATMTSARLSLSPEQRAQQQRLRDLERTREAMRRLRVQRALAAASTTPREK